ncbi:MAG: hypothetical protein QOD55_116, partial [Solirubrobacteraceae bacterium]|nr:hypothetical protein [Solirubrobacteraceae bacterium]
MATRTVLIRTALLLLPAAALAAGTAVPALAGTYDVVTCTTDAQVIPRPPVSGADDAWVTETNDPSHLEFVRRCPPQPAVDLDGMVVRTRLNSGGPVTGAYAHWRFDAPAGTSITRLRFWREIGKRVNDWELYSRTAEGTKLAATDCTRPPDEFTCQVGFPGGPPADWPGLDTTFVRVGMLCVETSCATGATLHEAWTAIYGAKVTVDDPTKPIATGGGGPLFAGGYLRGTVNATVGSASDNTGIRALQVREGATVVAEALQACDYSRRVPCADLTGGGSVSVSTAALADGAHTLA